MSAHGYSRTDPDGIIQQHIDRTPELRTVPRPAPEDDPLCVCEKPLSDHYDDGRGRRYCQNPHHWGQGHEPPTFTAVFAGAPCACGHEKAVHCPTVNGKPLPPGHCFRVDCDCEQYTPAVAAAPTGEEAGYAAKLAKALRDYAAELANVNWKGGAIGASVIDDAADALTAQATALAALGEDKAALDWLEENISYVMLGANYEAARPVAGLLLNKGTGWRDGELRNAVRVMRERDAARRGNEAR